MPAPDPQSYRFRIYSVLDVRNTDGTYRNEYPRLLWEEPPGREIGLDIPQRMNPLSLEAEEFSRTEDCRVCIARAFLFDDKPVEFLYTLDARVPSVQFIPAAAVWVSVPKAVVA